MFGAIDLDISSYLDPHLEIDSENRLKQKLYDKRDDFNFSMMNFPFISNNIPAASVYEVYISQLIQYSRGHSFYRWLLLTRKPLT